MEPNEEQNKSTRTYNEWKDALLKIIIAKVGANCKYENIKDSKLKPYYDQGLMPDVCYRELFNR